MSAFALIVLMVIGSDAGALIGSNMGKTERQKNRFALIGRYVGAGIALCLGFII